MQPADGSTYRLPFDGRVGTSISADELEERKRLLERESAVAGHEVAPLHDLDAAIRSAREHGPLVGVTEEVAHAQRLGQRELQRRKRRRQAAKQARKRSR